MLVLCLVGGLMHTLIAVWSAPDEADQEAFEEHYTEVHAPLAASIPHLEELATTRTAEGLEGGDPSFYRVAEMVFESEEALEEAEQTDEWTELREDAGEMTEQFGVTLEVGIGEKEVVEGQG